MNNPENLRGCQFTVIDKKKYQELANDDGIIDIKCWLVVDKMDKAIADKYCGKTGLATLVGKDCIDLKFKDGTSRRFPTALLKYTDTRVIPQEYYDKIHQLKGVFDHLFIKDGGPGGGRGVLVNLKKVEIEPVFSEYYGTDEILIEIKHVHALSKLTLAQITTLLDERIIDLSFRASEWTDINRKYSVFQDGQMLPQEYSW